MAGDPPSGTVTFLLTDLEGSTRLWERDPEAMKAAMARHDEILEKTIAAHRGFVFARMGDGMASAFATAGDAVSGAAAIQRALADEPWDTASPLRTRIGLHTDEGVIVEGGGYANQPINRCSRLMAAAHGGQVVVSGATEALVRDQLAEGMGLIDLGEHRLRDLGRPTRVFQLNRADCPEEFPPLRSLDSFPGNLPAQVSSFIGRRAEVSRVAAALGESRVVTITGVGGVGKTRLAIQVAADLLPRYREGAWLVELAPVRDPAGVTEAVAAVFHLAARSGQSLEDSLIEQLAQKQLLLVLDNCEHLLGSVARLVTRIERECPGVVVLATSREGMAIEGEQLIALPPLEAGEPDEDLERLVHTDAVCLFVERARRVKAEFALTDSNARAVVEACQRLDGVPLAIELAAARVIALNPAELVRRLDRRFQVLAGGRRGAVERHATLRAAIDWSYELLGAAEQRLLARMAVFSGGATLEATEEICSGDPVEREAIIDLVTGLVARSLVVAEDHVTGTRYRLLETIRQYGEERLAEWGETETLWIRHARFYAALSTRAAKRFYGPEQLVWGRQVNLERDNIRSALANAIDADDAALAVQLVADHPHRLSTSASPIGEAFPLPASRVLDMAGAPQQRGYPRVLMVAAWHALYSGGNDIADKLCRQALEATRSLLTPLPGPRIESDACALQAQRSLSAGAYADAVSSYTRAAELANADGYPGLAAVYLAYGVSTALLGGGGVEQATAQAEESVALARRSGMPGAIVQSLNALALTLVDHDPVRAKALLLESVDRGSTPGVEISPGFVTGVLVAGRLQDRGLTLALAGRSMYLSRMSMAQLQAATCLAECARVFAEDRPEVAGVLRGAAYAAFGRASPTPNDIGRPDTDPVDPNTNFVLTALRETGDLVAAALGDERRRELRTVGAAMSMDEAISYALANIDPKLITGPVTSAPKQKLGQ
jgi:predicted ATPase/class 3 adenylate cyclase